MPGGLNPRSGVYLHFVLHEEVPDCILNFEVSVVHLDDSLATLRGNSMIIVVILDRFSGLLK